MQIHNILFVTLLFLVTPATMAQAPQAQHKTLLLMGTRFELTAIHTDPQLAWDAINAGIAEVSRIETLISSWDSASQTSKINRNAGIRPVQVDQELYDLIFRSLKISRLTEGAFDISFASMDRIWKFDGSMTEMPDSSIVKKAALKIGYQQIVLNAEERTVFLKEKGMRIGFGAIGKGYAANRAKAIMQSMGIANGLVNAAGDLIAWGKMENGEAWKIGIADPVKKNQVMSWLTIQEGAVVTSGDYERYVMFGGKRYAHIIDPRTGYPTTGIKSVTIVCPDPELADALATSVFVLGQSAGLNLINQLRGVECLIITDNNQLLASQQLELHYEGADGALSIPTHN